MSEESNRDKSAKKSAKESSKNTQPKVQSSNSQSGAASCAPKGAVNSTQVVIFGALILLIIAMLTTGFYGFSKLNQLADQNETLATELHAKQVTQDAKLDDSIAGMKETVDAKLSSSGDLANQIDKNTQDLKALKTSGGFSPSDLAIAQAFYLVKRANLDLSLQGDVAQSVTLLNKADKELAPIDDPDVIAARQVIAQDVSALKTVEVVDTTGLYARLTALSNAITNLTPLTNPMTSGVMDGSNANDKTNIAIKPNSHNSVVLGGSNTGTDKVVASNDQFNSVSDSKLNKDTSGDMANNEKPMPTWKDVWASSKKTLSKLFVVRHHGSPDALLLTPEQSANIYQHLQLQIDKAQVALLNHQAKLYQESLKPIAGIVKHYFDPNVVAKHIVDESQALAAVDIAPVIPTVEKSLGALEKLDQSRQKNA